MTTTIAIDTLSTMRKLEKAGFQTDQAEAVAEVVAHQGSGLATKADLKLLRADLELLKADLGSVEKSLHQEIAGVRQEMAGLEKSLHQEMAGLEKSLRQEIAGVRQETAGLRWMFGLHAAFTLAILGVVAALTWQVFAIGRDVSGLVATLMAG